VLAEKVLAASRIPRPGVLIVGLESAFSPV